MALRLEEYALLGDTQAAALVGIDGSVDWMCLPRFDSGACFSALLGGPEHGRWLVAPKGRVVSRKRRYRPDTLVLETELETETGVARLVDCMPIRGDHPDLVRIVEGLHGHVEMRMELVIRFDYGSIVPWVRQVHGKGLLAVGGPDALTLRSKVPTRGEGMTTVADFTVGKGDRVPFSLIWHPSHQHPPEPRDAFEQVHHTEQWWKDWVRRCTYKGEWRDAVVRSLITLKALTYGPTGGIVAAPTTSLPEQIGGVRNWDYRFCWVRDATLTLFALAQGGYHEEARAWRDWLLRSVAGSPDDLQIMYGVAGERRLNEVELPWLPGYEGSQPVRVGNKAVEQRQLDVYGELMDALFSAQQLGVASSTHAWALQRNLMKWLETGWNQPDAGIWEVRGPPRDFVHSKVNCWVAMDRAVKSIEQFGLEGPLDKWKGVRDAIHEEVCARGWDPERKTFTQYYGSHDLDASLLTLPLVGFLPPSDPRMRGTVAAVERELLRDGFVMRYPTHSGGDVDGLPAGEGSFLACTFWLADCYAVMGRGAEARQVFERLLGLRNDVGLLAEEYDHDRKRQVGNFPQAFSHIGLINTASNLAQLPSAPTQTRGDGKRGEK